MLLLLACNRPSVTGDQQIREAESIVWEAPDSALVILDAIDTLQLDARQQAYYSLVLIQALNKAGYDISGEEKVFELKEYYAHGKDAWKAAKAAYYAGRVYQMRGDHTNAAQAYLDALRYEERFEDRQLKGLVHINLGMLHYEQSHYHETIDELKKSSDYFPPNTQYYTSFTLNKIGNAYSILQQTDSAFTYYGKALTSARQGNDSVLLSNILQNMGVLLDKLGNYPEARKYYHEAVTLIEEQGRAVPYLNLGWTYFQTNQWDSAGYYAGQSHRLLRDEGYLYALVSVYELLYRVEKAKENYQDALAWHEQYTDSLFVAQEKKAPNILKKINKVVFGNEEFDWEKFFLTFNTLEEGLLEKAQEFFKGYPDLDDIDFQVWYLSYAEYTQQEMVSPLKLKLRNLQRRITKIREVFGIEERGDIHRFVKDHVQKPPVATDQ